MGSSRTRAVRARSGWKSDGASQDLKIGTPAHLNKKVKGEYSKTEIKDDEALAVRAMARTAVHNVTSTDTIKGLQTTSLCDTQLKEVATQIAEARNILDNIEQKSKEATLSEGEEVERRAQYISAFGKFLNAVSLYDTWQTRWNKQIRPANWQDVTSQIQALSSAFGAKGYALLNKRVVADSHYARGEESEFKDFNSDFVTTDPEAFSNKQAALDKKNERRNYLKELAEAYNIEFKDQKRPCDYRLLKNGLTTESTGRYVTRFGFSTEEMIPLIQAAVPKIVNAITSPAEDKEDLANQRANVNKFKKLGITHGRWAHNCEREEFQKWRIPTKISQKLEEASQKLQTSSDSIGDQDKQIQYLGAVVQFQTAIRNYQNWRDSESYDPKTAQLLKAKISEAGKQFANYSGNKNAENNLCTKEKEYGSRENAKKVRDKMRKALTRLSGKTSAKVYSVHLSKALDTNKESKVASIAYKAAPMCQLLAEKVPQIASDIANDVENAEQLDAFLNLQLA